MLANGFAGCDDPAALQQQCDRLGTAHLRMFFERWMARLPLPLDDADRAAGYWWQLSMRQIETSRNIVLDDPRRARTVFEQLLAGNIHLGRPENLEVVFARRSPATRSAATWMLNRADQVTVNFGFRRSRIKDLSEGRPCPQSRGRLQRPGGPGLQARPGSPGRPSGHSPCMQRPADARYTCRPGRWLPGESSL